MAGGALMPGEDTRAWSCALVIRSLRTDSETRQERGLRARFMDQDVHRTAVGGWNPPLAPVYFIFYDAAAESASF